MLAGTVSARFSHSERKLIDGRIYHVENKPNYRESFLAVGALSRRFPVRVAQAENTTNAVTDSTSNTVGSVLDAVGSVIHVPPFNLVGDLFS